MATDMSLDQGRVRGEPLSDGLSALATGKGPPLVILPGFGPGADLSARVPRSTAWSAAALQLALDHPGTVRRLVLRAASAR
jgi:hypothetical protein